MKAKIKYIKVRNKKEGDIPDGTFNCDALKNTLSAKKGDIATFVLGSLEFELEVE